MRLKELFVLVVFGFLLTSCTKEYHQTSIDDIELVENIDLDKTMYIENRTANVDDQFKQRVDLLQDLLEVDGINNYFDPSFLEVGTIVGGLEVTDIQGLLWFDGTICFSGEYTIKCKLSDCIMDDSDVLILAGENDLVIRPVYFYNSTEDIKYNIRNIEAFDKMTKGKDLEDKVITLLVKDYHLTKKQIKISQFIDVVEIIDISG